MQWPLVTNSVSYSSNQTTGATGWTRNTNYASNRFKAYTLVYLTFQIIGDNKVYGFDVEGNRLSEIYN